MSFEFPLVFFTVFTQLGVGMAMFLCWKLYAQPQTLTPQIIKRAWGWITAAGVAGLICSLFHLGHPFNAYKALYNLGVSWLSWEGLGFACFCVLAFINIFHTFKMLTLATVIVGAFSLVAQGLTYAVPAIPALNNMLPMAMFWLSALAMGGCATILLISGHYENITRLLLLALIVILLAAPASWISGSAAMTQSSLLWASSPWFWIGLTLLCFTFIGTWFYSKWDARLQIACLICGVICTRMVFFADTAHTASNLGLPFN